MFGIIITYNTNNTITFYYFTMTTNFFYRSPYFHFTPCLFFYKYYNIFDFFKIDKYWLEIIKALTWYINSIITTTTINNDVPPI